MANRTRKAEHAEKPKKPINIDDIDLDDDDASDSISENEEAEDIETEISDTIEAIQEEEKITVRKLGGGLHTLRDGTKVNEGDIIKTTRSAIPVAFWDLFEIIK